MPVIINGSGSVTGLSVGGLPDGTVDADTLASNAVTSAKLASGVGGKILQVVQTVKTDVFSTTAAVSSIDVTGLSVSITPTSTSSKILIFSDVGGHVHNSQGGSFQIHRQIASGSFSVLSTGLADADGNRLRSNFTGTLYTGDGGGSNDITLTANCKLLDSPSTTSAVTYKVVMQRNNNNDLYCINRTESDDNSTDEGRTMSQIMVMEVAA